MVPALIAALAIVVGEVALLAVAGKLRSRQDGSHSQLVLPSVASSDLTSYPKGAASTMADVVTFVRAFDLATQEYGKVAGLEMSRELSRQHFLAVRRLHQLQRQARASSLKGTTLSILAEQRIYLMSLELERRRFPALSCDDWQVIPQGQDAFTVDAGAFAIEHFGGKTNIRILDPLRVSIEGPTRGVPVDNSPPGINTENYH
jgi:hypothetical protein